MASLQEQLRAKAFEKIALANRARVADQAYNIGRGTRGPILKSAAQANAAKRALIANPRVQFADWLKRTMPQVYEGAEAAANSTAVAVFQKLKSAVQASAAEGTARGRLELMQTKALQQASRGITPAMMQRMEAQAAGVFDTGLGQWDFDFLAPVQTATTEVVEKSFWQKFLDGAIGAGTAYLSLKNQKDILALNIERAKIGQPPLDAAATAPVIRTQVEIAPETARNLVAGIGAGINQNLLIIGGVALVALFLIMRK